MNLRAMHITTDDLSLPNKDVKFQISNVVLEQDYRIAHLVQFLSWNNQICIFCDGHPHRTIFIRDLLCYTTSDGQVANEWKEVAPLAITVMITRQSGAACGIHQYLSHWFQEL